MPICRIQSVYMEDGEEAEDIMVFDVFIQNDLYIKPMEIFGYAMEDNEKWPITIKKLRNEGMFDWGAGDEETVSTINIFDKKISVGEYFTRTDKADNITEKHTYKIKLIFNWDELS